MTEKRKGTSKPGSLMLNLLALIFVLASLLLAAYFGYIYANPYSDLNPLAPPPIAKAEAAGPTSTLPPTATSTASPSQPLETDTQAVPPTSAPTAGPTATMPALPTATNVVINTLAPTVTAEPLGFVAQEGTPSYLPYSGGCSGLYIAGNITDIDHNPVVLMTVRASGTLGGEQILTEVLSGSNTDYTASGWEIKLSDDLAASSGTITVALYKQGAWDPISEEVAIDTFNDCSRNLIVVNFVQE